MIFLYFWQNQTRLRLTVIRKRYFHLDLDAFFAAIEQADHPEYRLKPVIIGGFPGKRGVVAACSYQARKFGVHSAMPMAQAVRLCPEAVFLKPRRERYLEISSRLMELFGEFSPLVHQVSIDEASLDMSGTERLFGADDQAGYSLKQAVKKQSGLTVSVGIAPNRYLAKLASDFDKPDGLTIIAPGREKEFVSCLPLAKLWGIGAKTLRRLHDLDIKSVEQLRGASAKNLEIWFGKAGCRFLRHAALGRDPGFYSETIKSHSLSHETTFETDTLNRDTINRTLLELSHQVMFRLLRQKASSKTAFIKIRFADFTTITRQKSFGQPIRSAEQLHQTVFSLFTERQNRLSPIRLLGVGLASVKQNEAHQADLFEARYEKKRRLEKIAAELNQNGKNLVKAGFLISQKTAKNKHP